MRIAVFVMLAFSLFAGCTQLTPTPADLPSDPSAGGLEAQGMNGAGAAGLQVPANAPANSPGAGTAAASANGNAAGAGPNQGGAPPQPPARPPPSRQPAAPQAPQAPSAAPALGSFEVSGASTNAVDISYVVTGDGQVQSWVSYGRDPARLTMETTPVAGTGAIALSVGGLAAGTWYVQVHASNQAGTTQTQPQGFSTQSPSQPSQGTTTQGQPRPTPSPSPSSNPGNGGSSGGNGNGTCTHSSSCCGYTVCCNQGTNCGSCASPPCGPTCHGNGGHRVFIQNHAFSPANLTINCGDTVVWHMQDPTFGCHPIDPADPSFGPAGPLASSGNMTMYSWTYKAPGTHTVHCKNPSWVTSTIHVV